jgi:predicted DNA-binding ribbon-helix-helix protein
VPTIDLDWELIEVDCALLLRSTLTRRTEKQRDGQQNVKSDFRVHCHEYKSAKVKTRFGQKQAMEMPGYGKHGKP